MTINNWEAYRKSIWDWAFLKPCFGNSGIEPTDIDGFAERKQQFLVLETKKPGVAMPEGQALAFTRLVETGYVTVITIWGKPGKPEQMSVWQPGDMAAPQEADEAAVKREVSEWYKRANSQY